MAVGETWIDDFSNTGHTALIFSYRFVCQNNYFGDKCVDYCQPRDDKHGHYTCSEEGKKVCMPGWKGHYCNVGKCIEDELMREKGT